MGISQKKTKIKGILNRLNHLSVTNPRKITTQLLLYVTMYTYIANGFVAIPQRQLVQVILSILTLTVALFEMWDNLVVQDIVVGVILAILLLFYRFVSHPGHASLLNSFVRVAACYVLGLLFRHSLLDRRLLMAYVLAVIAPFIYTLFILKVVPTSYFYRINRNAIGYFLVFASSLYVLNDVLNSQAYIPLLPVAAVTVAAFASKSRTGLLMASYLLVLVAFYNGVSVLKSRKTIIEREGKQPSMLIKVIVVLGMLALLLLLILFFTHSRFATNGMKSSGRVQILHQFFSSLDFKKVVLGQQPSPANVINWHNSFVTMNAFFGILSFPLLAMILVSFFKFAKRHWALVGLFILWGLYSIPETVSPYGHGDYLLVPLLMIAYPPQRLDTPIACVAKQVFASKDNGRQEKQK